MTIVKEQKLPDFTRDISIQTLPDSMINEKVEISTKELPQSAPKKQTFENDTSKLSRHSERTDSKLNIRITNLRPSKRLFC